MIQEHTYKGLYYRNETDKMMIRESLRNYHYFNFTPNSIVMDFGANIGGFAHMCKNENVKKYIGFEADPDNFKVLLENVPNNGTAINGAVSHLKDETITFHRTPIERGSCSGTVTPSKLYKARSINYEVKNYYINDVLEKYKPSHVKMDIEGTEFQWFELIKGKIPNYVKEFAFELHNNFKVYKWVEMWYNTIIKDFDIINVNPDMGFKKGKPYSIPELGIEGTGRLFGVDLFLRRK